MTAMRHAADLELVFALGKDGWCEQHLDAQQIDRCERPCSTRDDPAAIDLIVSQSEQTPVHNSMRVR